MADGLSALKQKFFEKQLEFEPVTGYYWGIESLKAKARPYDESLRHEQRTFYTRLLADLEGFSKRDLSTKDSIDFEIMRTYALWQLLRLDDPQPLNWQSTVDLSYLVHIVYYNLARQSGKTAEWDAVVAKVNQIPEIIRVHQKNLEIGINRKARFYKREVEREAIQLAPVISKYFKEEILKTARQSLSKALLSKYEPKLKKAAKQIDQALKAYVAFVKSKVLPKSKNENFAIGEEEYAWRLKHLLFWNETPEKLFTYGKAKVVETGRQMQRLADEIQKKRGGSSLPLKAVLDELQKDAPTTDQAMFEMYREDVDRVVAFIRQKQLFRLPVNYKIDLTETPEAYHNVLSVAAMNPVPPFSDTIPAQFWVTPTRSAKFPNGNPKLLQENHARAAAPNLVVHEAVPGHDLQTGFSARRFIEGGRQDLSFKVRSFCPDVMFCQGVEGWAHYTEQLMAEQGFLTPEQRLYQLKDAQWRNVRIVVDVGIHTGRMSYKEAVQYMAEHTFAGELTSEREIYRYSKMPLQAITYHLGKREILELREEVQKRCGIKFDLAKFHEDLLSYDGVPIALFRNELLSASTTLMRR
jgi:uncharacterized protein (DUF885 family)